MAPERGAAVTWEERLRQAGYVITGATASRMPQEPRSPQDDTQTGGMTEDTLLAHVRALAKQYGYLCYHTYSSKRSEPGYPDLCLARPASATSPGRLLFAELKTQTGKVTQEQAIWLDILRHTIPGLEAYTWRPADLPTIAAILSSSQP